MKTALITIVSIFLTVLGIAQTPAFQWVKSMGGSAGYDEGKSIAVDSSGNIYTIGKFRGTVDFDPGPGVVNLIAAGTDNIFISKLDSAGNFIWAKQMGDGGSGGGTGYTIYLDSLGNIYSTGSFFNTVDFDPGAAVFNLSATLGQSAYVSKLDSAGNFIWAKQFAAGTSGS